MGPDRHLGGTAVRKALTLAVFVALSAAILLSQGQHPAAEGSAPDTQPAPLKSKYPKLASSLARLVDATLEATGGSATTSSISTRGARPALAVVDAPGIQLDGEGRVQVYITVSDAVEDALDRLGAMGVVVDAVSQPGTLVQARAEVLSLPAVAELDFVSFVSPPRYGRPAVGSRLSQGDSLLRCDSLRATLGVNGTGITIGVISDGIGGLLSAVNSGDLPSTQLTRSGGVLISTQGGVIAQSFRTDGDLEGALGGSSGSEGTAMLEIVHDIAPGAQLRFANFATSLEFMQAVNFLASNSDVVIDDIGFYGGPYDQTSDVSVNTAAALNNLANSIRGYYTSGGNQALSHYQGTFVSAGACLSDGSTCHRFAATSDTTDALSLGPQPYNPVFVLNGETLAVELTWDDSFGSATTDYDLMLFDETSAVSVAVGGDDNTVSREPYEYLTWKNQTGSSRWYDIWVTNFQGTQPAHDLELFVFGGTPLNGGADINFNTTRSSVSAQSDAGGGVVSVGAINAAEPGVNDIAPYSSRGPTNNGVVKPDVTAIDGVSVTGSGGFPSTFFGTSAAAPHVAALAALLLELSPELLSGGAGDDPAADRQALRAAIVGTASDLGIAGVDNTYGSGRVDGLAAGLALAPATPTPTPTPAPTPVPGVGPWAMVAMMALVAVLTVGRTGGRRRT